MKKQQRTIGSVVKISLPDGTHGYGLVLDKASIAVYNIKTEKAIPIEQITSKDTLFILTVHKSAISSGRWVKVGKILPEDKYSILPLQFIQDIINPEQFSIYDPNTGNIYPAKREDCMGLECAAVWEAEHVEDRILDHFAGRENIMVQSHSNKVIKSA
jgi:hypothetical protein